MTLDGNLTMMNLANQLKCPSGENAGIFAQDMYKSNKGMIVDSISALRITDKNRILELGPAGGSHLSLIFQQALELKYFGLDISEAMVNEARAVNGRYIKGKKALFDCYDGTQIPYVHGFFDRILTVNTIYFWKQPKAFLIELYRVLRPGGFCVVTFVEGNFMKLQPFVDDTFELFDITRFANLVSRTPFTKVDVQTKQERTSNKLGKPVEREFLVATLQKPLNI